MATNYITKTIKNGVEANIPVTSVNWQYGDVTITPWEENNVKVFTLSSTSDLTNAQAAVNWMISGGVALIKYSNHLYYSESAYSTAVTGGIPFYRIVATPESTSGGSIVYNANIWVVHLTLSSWTVTKVTYAYGAYLPVSDTVARIVTSTTAPAAWTASNIITIVTD